MNLAFHVDTTELRKRFKVNISAVNADKSHVLSVMLPPVVPFMRYRYTSWVYLGYNMMTHDLLFFCPWEQMSVVVVGDHLNSWILAWCPLSLSGPDFVWEYDGWGLLICGMWNRQLFHHCIEVSFRSFEILGSIHQPLLWNDQKLTPLVVGKFCFQGEGHWVE